MRVMWNWNFVLKLLCSVKLLLLWSLTCRFKNNKSMELFHFEGKTNTTWPKGTNYVYSIYFYIHFGRFIAAFCIHKL